MQGVGGRWSSGELEVLEQGTHRYFQEILELSRRTICENMKPKYCFNKEIYSYFSRVLLEY